MTPVSVSGISNAVTSDAGWGNSCEVLTDGTTTSAITTNTNTLGKYCWRVTYSGDTSYIQAAHTNVACECFTVQVPPIAPQDLRAIPELGVGLYFYEVSALNVVGEGPRSSEAWSPVASAHVGDPAQTPANLAAAAPCVLPT